MSACESSRGAPMTAPSPTRASQTWRAHAGRAALLVIGVAAVVALIHLAGLGDVARVVRRAGPVVPLLFACEGARIALELRATRSLYAALGAKVPIPMAALVRAHLIGAAMTTALPAGRAVAEAYVATALARFASPSKAAAVATVNHALAMAANALVATVCLVAVYRATGLSPLTVATLLHAGAVGSIALALTVLSRSRRACAAARRMARFFLAPARARGVLRGIEATGEACRAHRLFPWSPLVDHVVARALQAVGVGLLLATITGTQGASSGRLSALRGGLLGQAVHLVGTSAGDLIPLQLGATDGGFVLAAPLLGIGTADAVAAALVLHGVHLAWTAVGALVPLLWRRAPTQGSIRE